ncbi:MAG: SufD family Fe-S cluster assembly protein [Oscillospiraceae bacterium]|nr:SufD family Fe-S cluster assembly protein [Oscillospiraceae bacterium]
MLDNVVKSLLKSVADIGDIPVEGAYNIRMDGAGAGRRSTENVVIETKADKPGIDIFVKPFTKNERVHIPVVITKTGLSDTVYNDFFIGEGADVTIVAGCGIHNSGCDSARHDGIHRFFIGKGARLKYVEKHYGEGEGTGERVLNPTTVVDMDENSVCEMETVQIRGVDSTVRETSAALGAGAKLIVTERLMTHGRQTARSNMEVQLNGEGASAQIVSRSVARDSSEQVFYPKAVGNSGCKAHVQCDSIIMDGARIRSIPEISANHPDANIVHEAAIGKINGEQMIKLQTLGLTEAEAETVIIDGFLK